MKGVVTQPLTPDRWPDFKTVLGGSGQSGCWCMYWLTETSKAFRAGCQGGADAPNQASFEALMRDGPAPGLLTYQDDVPVAWVRVMPRSAHPALAASRYFATDLDIEGVWSLSCFVVRAKWRRQGMMATLIKAAMAHAAAQGAQYLEAYPTDTAQKKSSSAVYLGVASTFLRLGFQEVQRRAPEKPMLRIALA